MLKGIDISDVNSPINIEGLPDLGISFVWMKVSEGGTFLDKTFQGYYQRVKALKGVARGGYCFWRANAPWLEQVNTYLSVGINFSLPGCLPPTLDVEEQGDEVDAEIAKNPQPYIDGINNWIAEIKKRTGAKVVIIYSDRSYFKDVLGGATFPGTLLWLADYNPEDEAKPPTLNGWDKATFLQYTDKWNNSDIDGDCFNGTEQEFNQLANII